MISLLSLLNGVTATLLLQQWSNGNSQSQGNTPHAYGAIQVARRQLCAIWRPSCPHCPTWVALQHTQVTPLATSQQSDRNSTTSIMALAETDTPAHRL